jgi:hypothetical protein
MRLVAQPVKDPLEHGCRSGTRLVWTPSTHRERRQKVLGAVQKGKRCIINRGTWPKERLMTGEAFSVHRHSLFRIRPFFLREEMQCGEYAITKPKGFHRCRHIHQLLHTIGQTSRNARCTAIKDSHVSLANNVFDNKDRAHHLKLSQPQTAGTHYAPLNPINSVQ